MTERCAICGRSMGSSKFGRAFRNKYYHMHVHCYERTLLRAIKNRKEKDEE